MSTSALPQTMKALKTQNGPTVKVEDIPLGSLDAVKHLHPDFILVKNAAVSPVCAASRALLIGNS
jgi:hypothetical protein